MILLNFSLSCKASLGEDNAPKIVKESGTATLRLFDLDGEPFGPTIEWEIDWPVGGDASIRNKIKTDIIDMLSLHIPTGRTVDNVTPKELFQETVIHRYKDEYAHIKTPAQYEEEVSEVFWCDGDDCSATIEIWDDALVNITTTNTQNFINGTPYPEINNKLFRIDTGENWSLELLPADSKLLPLLAAQWVKLGYRAHDVAKAGDGLLDADSRYWTKEGLTFFYWKPFSLEIPDVEPFMEVTIPYKDLLPLLSPDARGFIMPSILKSGQNSSVNDLTDKLIYSLFFVEKGEWSYNEAMQNNFKRLEIDGPLPYSIFSNELSSLNTRAQKAYREWQQRNPDEEDYVALDFPDVESNVLKSYFDNQDGGSPFNITVLGINQMSDKKAEVKLLCDNSESMLRIDDEFRKLAGSGYGSVEQDTRILILVKEDGKWKVDNIITEFKYNDEVNKTDWKQELKSFISNPVEFMPYYGM